MGKGPAKEKRHLIDNLPRMIGEGNHVRAPGHSLITIHHSRFLSSWIDLKSRFAKAL